MDLNVPGNSVQWLGFKHTIQNHQLEAWVPGQGVQSPRIETTRLATVGNACELNPANSRRMARFIPTPMHGRFNADAEFLMEHFGANKVGIQRMLAFIKHQVVSRHSND